MTIESDSTENWHEPPPFDPEPYALAMLAAQLSGGENPEKYLRPAYELCGAAKHVLHEIADEEVIALDFDECCRRRKEWVWFEPNSDWDQIRDYLQIKGCKLQNSETILRNLRVFFTDTDQLDMLQTLNRHIKRMGKAHIPKSVVDQLIRSKKQRKSEGGKKSFKTRQERSAPTIVAKKQKK